MSLDPIWPALVADIGGTNARFGLVDGPGAEARMLRHLPTPDFAGLAEAIDAYAEAVGERPKSGCAAVAGPVRGDRISLTNARWDFSVDRTRRQCGLSKLLMLNDCAALALALPRLSAGDAVPIGEPPVDRERPMAVVAPGTGMGCAGLLRHNGQSVAAAGEFGHADLSPVDDVEIEVLRVLRVQRGRVSLESVLSGAGLLRLRHALATVLGQAADPIDVAELVRLGTTTGHSDTLCRLTLDVFCALLGGLAGNLALAFGAWGGVFVGGGIVPRFPHFFAGSAFRRRFEEKGRMTPLLRQVATRLIVADNVTLRGAAAHLEDSTA